MTSADRNAQREQGSWNVPGAASAYPPAGEQPPAVRRGRPGLVALVVAVVELAVIAAVGNQSVSKHSLNYGLDHVRSFLGQTVLSLVQFTWRVTPRDGDNRDGFHVYYSQLTAIAVLVVVSVLLSLVALRGAVTFWRALVGVWTSVVVAAFVGRIVGALVTKPVDAEGSRAVAAVFRSTGASTFVYGVLLGLLTGVVAAAVAVGTRRTVDAPAAVQAGPAEPAYVPETPPPFYGTPAQDRGAPAQPYGTPAPGYGTPAQPYGTPAPGYKTPTPGYGTPAPGYGTPTPGYGTPAQGYGTPAQEGDPRAENETTALPAVADQGGDAQHTQQLPEVAEGDEPDGRTTQIPRFDPRGGQHWTPPEQAGESTQAIPAAPDDGDGRRPPPPQR